MKKYIKGFTLIEIAIVLVIIGLLVGSGFSTLGAYLDNAKQSHTEGSLLVTKQALLNYVKVNKHMPCPDSDGDGSEEPRIGANSTRCSTSLGTVPFNDIGISRAVASDDYGNLFGYAIHEGASSSAVMDVALGDSSLLMQPGAYFYNEGAPVFDIDTPPTVNNSDSSAESYRVCSRTAANDCSGTNDVEMEFLPVVLIAYNENGSNVSLTSCTGSWGLRENENCDTTTDTNPTFLRGVFNSGVFDDQIETISAYEIKKYALGSLDDFELEPPSGGGGTYAGYDVVYLKNVNSANDINISDDDDNNYYIGVKTDEDGNVVDDTDNDGNLSANAVFSGGDDELYMEGSITTSGDLKMGGGDDKLTVETNVEGSVNTGTGLDYIYIQGGVSGSISAGDDFDTLIFDGNISGSIDSELGSDLITINSDIESGATVTTGPSAGQPSEVDSDTLQFNGTIIAGSIEMGKDADTIQFTTAADVSGVIDGEGGEDTLVLIGVTLAEFQSSAGDTDFSDNSGSIRNFETVSVE